MYDLQHAVNVARLSMQIGKCLGFDTESLMLLYTAGLFHDIGKMLVPEELLEKPATLSRDEYRIIQWHTTLGYGLLSQMPDSIHSTAAEAALYHHERVDGSGYLGMRGKEIPLFARIIAIADVLDALTANRPYREAWDKDDALDYIYTHSGSMFDAEITTAYLRTK